MQIGKRVCGLGVVALACAAGLASAGPDVIVGDLHQVTQHATSAGYPTLGFTMGTYSCNIGDARLNWFQAPDARHPVIGQGMYRYSPTNGGRFEHIGMSFVKHGFFALSNTLCATCNDPTNGTQLGVGCSDPYSTSNNSSQGSLGPRSQINAATGVNPGNWSGPISGNPSYNLPAAGTDARAVARRGQVAKTDLDPALNPGAVYVFEGQYVAQDDTTAGNGHNNNSYRRVYVTYTSASNITLNYTSGASTSATRRQKPAIEAWREFGTGVTVVGTPYSTPAVLTRDQNLADPYTMISGDGRVALGYKVTDLGGNQWQYEYALQNLTSHRCVSSFVVPMDSGASATTVGFHGVSHHSGDDSIYDNAAWNDVKTPTELSWSAPTPPVGKEANAIRWGTLYNFRFISNRPPVNGQVTLGLFRPGAPTTVAIAAQVPDNSPPTCVADYDDGSGTGTPDGGVDISDLLYYLGLFDAGNLDADIDDGSGTGTSDGGVDISDLLYFLVRFDLGC